MLETEKLTNNRSSDQLGAFKAAALKTTRGLVLLFARSVSGNFGEQEVEFTTVWREAVSFRKSMLGAITVQ